MSDFDYYYHTVDKARGSEVLDALRQSDDKTKAEAIDYLIDRGYLHSEEIYNAAYVNAMGDYLGLSDYDPDDWDEYNAPVGRGTKHSALDEVHQRLREAGKKRRQQRIAQARRMKQRKFEGHHGHYHAEMTDEEVKEIITVVLEEDNPPESHSVYRKYPLEKVAMAMRLTNTRPSLKEWISTKVSKSAEMEMTPDIMDYPGLPVVPDSYGTNSALDSGNGVPQWYGSAETFEAPFAGAGSLFKFGGNDSALGGFTAKELTESSAIHGDFDHAALNYSGHQNIEARAEGYGDMSRYIRIDYTWDYQGEHEEAVSDADSYITDQIHELVEQEVSNGEYSGNGYYIYTVEYENDKGETIEEDVDIDFSWS